MEVVIPRCAGLDVQNRTIVACVRRLGPDGQLNQEVSYLRDHDCGSLSLVDWLAAGGVTQGTMESTGVCWTPVSNLLEARVTLIVVHAQHIKQVPGRKTDVTDCPWIAQLLQDGLLRASFVPPQLIRQLRDLTRQRTPLIRQRATMANRLQKVLEDATIKLASVATDILGVSGRAMIRALIAGEQDPAPGRLGPPSAPGQDRPAGPRLDRPSLRPSSLPTPGPDGTGMASVCCTTGKVRLCPTRQFVSWTCSMSWNVGGKWPGASSTRRPRSGSASVGGEGVADASGGEGGLRHRWAASEDDQAEADGDATHDGERSGGFLREEPGADEVRCIPDSGLPDRQWRGGGGVSALDEGPSGEYGEVLGS